MLELNNGCVAINADKFTKLITALRTVVEKGEGALDKEATNACQDVVAVLALVFCFCIYIDTLIIR